MSKNDGSPSGANNKDSATAAMDGDYADPNAKSTYVLDFGRHSGMELSDIPTDYLAWLLIKDRDDSLTTMTPKIKRALVPHWKDAREKVDHWTQPKATFPARFLDFDENPLWITTKQASAIFGMELAHLIHLEPVDKTERFLRYWLYHVWDFVRVRDDERVADACLNKFMATQRQREEDVWASMGLGQCCD